MTPFSGKQRVTSPYGYRKDPFGSGKTVWHGGIDVVSQEDKWQVRETTGGTVIEISTGHNSGRGALVKVQSGSAVVITQHYDSVQVKKGDKVCQGDVLGMAGSSGDVTGRHLHFEVQKNGSQVNPSEWLGLPNTTGSYEGNNNLDLWSVTNERTETGDTDTAGHAPDIEDCPACTILEETVDTTRKVLEEMQSLILATLEMIDGMDHRILAAQEGI